VASAIISRYGRSVPWLPIGLAGGGGIAAYSWFMFIQPDLAWRILALNLPYGVISLIVAAELRTVAGRGPVERMLIGLALAAAATFIVGPVTLLATDGGHAHPGDVQTTAYWTATVLAHAVLSLLLALCLFAGEALDLMRALRFESITDPLSGLLNRRGFEASATEMLEKCLPGRIPVALIVADLDRFKAVNDSHGHAAGDRVIAAFAMRLQSAAGSRAVAGRLGGEEFALLLPLADAAAARLLADAVRRAFSGDDIAGLPRGVRMTSSFGIAVRTDGESLQELMRRGDEALYCAKRDGRDCVRLFSDGTPEPLIMAASIGAR
jgi:diguanylate cyclase (GGDEF)-like protein